MLEIILNYFFGQGELAYFRRPSVGFGDSQTGAFICAMELMKVVKIGIIMNRC